MRPIATSQFGLRASHVWLLKIVKPFSWTSAYKFRSYSFNFFIDEKSECVRFKEWFIVFYHIITSSRFYYNNELYFDNCMKGDWQRQIKLNENRERISCETMWGLSLMPNVIVSTDTIAMSTSLCSHWEQFVIAFEIVFSCLVKRSIGNSV